MQNHLILFENCLIFTLFEAHYIKAPLILNSVYWLSELRAKLTDCNATRPFPQIYMFICFDLGILRQYFVTQPDNNHLKLRCKQTIEIPAYLTLSTLYRKWILEKDSNVLFNQDLALFKGKRWDFLYIQQRSHRTLLLWQHNEGNGRFLQANH